jgi:hypothetical protein
MNTSGASKILPIILTAITLATAVFFYNQREVLRQKTQELLSQSTKPTPSVAVTPPLAGNPPLAETPTPTPTSSPTPTPKTIASTKTTIVCTPVYGMANTCAEHAVVDTALDTSIFYNLAGMSYIFGLAAFIKSKRA